MKKATVVLVAAMILLAGCSGGGGTATPTDTQGTETTDDGTMNGDGDVQQPNVSEALSSLNTSSDSDLFSNATELNMTFYNGSQQVGVLIQNDSATNTQLIRLSDPSSGTTTFYNTSDYAAVRNSSSGEVQYGEPGGNIGFGVAFGSALILISGVSFAGVVEWQQGGTTTVDGETAFVYEADSLNQTAVQQRNSEQNFGTDIDGDNIDSVDGEMIIGQNGQLHSLNVELTRSDETFGVDLSIDYDPVTIEQPDWVDESQAP